MSGDVQWQRYAGRDDRWSRLGQMPAIAWLTGLPGAGKTSICRAVEASLLDLGLHVCVLDGDNLRFGLNKDLDFSEPARAENVRRTVEVAKLTAEAGLVTLVALVSPSRGERAKARATVGEFPFLEVFVDTPLSICEARDPKGLYAKARVGEVSQFTGISATYESPESPDLTLHTTNRSIDASAAPLARRLLWLCRGMAGHLIEPVR